MHNHRSLVGLDVHAKATVPAVLDLETGELRFRRVTGPPRSVVSFLEELPGPVLATYEAGAVGYGLAREGAARGIEVRVCAPGSIPRKPGDRVKTDRRDAERLARSLLAGEAGGQDSRMTRARSLQARLDAEPTASPSWRRQTCLECERICVRGH